MREIMDEVEIERGGAGTAVVMWRSLEQRESGGAGR
jgi:hypothetical protein